MGAMTPMRYAERYLKLEVPFDDGPVWVQIRKYHIGTPDAEQGLLWQALKDYFNKQQKAQADFRLRVRVDWDTTDFASAHSMLHRVVDPFWGKGTPEDCQIVLQLAVLLGRVPSKLALQSYADAHLGLDCNGFVGNYLFRVLGSKGWRTDAPARGASPRATITDIMASAGGTEIHTVDQVTPGRMYVLAEVDANNRIIAGGPSSAPGHIVITEPGLYMGSYTSMNLDIADSGALGAPAVWGVESAGGIGLVQSWYAITQLKSGNKPVEGVFRVFRASRQRFLNFRMIALN
ncbi:MAG: hypothetical protein ACM3JC_07990 [Rudaea sp.]